MWRMAGGARAFAAAAVAACAAAAVAALTVLPPAAAAATVYCPELVAHRGVPTVAPEETLPSLMKAATIGADFVEFDIQFTRDGHAVLMHDPTVDRTTNGTGWVSSLSIQQIKALDAGVRFSPAYAGTRVPELATALRVVAPSRGVMVIPELKGNPTNAQLAFFAARVGPWRAANRVVVQSFSADVLRRLRARDPRITLALITTDPTTDPAPAVVAAKATYWLPRAGTVTRENVALAHAAGIRVMAWTSDDPAEWGVLADAGVDGIMTNDAGAYHDWALGRCGSR